MSARVDGKLAIRIMELILQWGPMPVVELAKLLKKMPNDIVSSATQSYCLSVDEHFMVRMDEKINDPDYGEIFPKEAPRLRKEKAPTLREIAEEARYLRMLSGIWRLDKVGQCAGREDQQ